MACKTFNEVFSMCGRRDGWPLEILCTILVSQSDGARLSSPRLHQGSSSALQDRGLCISVGFSCSDCCFFRRPKLRGNGRERRSFGLRYISPFLQALTYFDHSLLCSMLPRPFTTEKWKSVGCLDSEIWILGSICSSLQWYQDLQSYRFQTPPASLGRADQWWGVAQCLHLKLRRLCIIIHTANREQTNVGNDSARLRKLIAVFDGRIQTLIINVFIEADQDPSSRERVNQERPEDETVRKIPEWQPTRALAQVNTLDPHYRAVQIAKVIESDMAIFNGSPDDNHKAFPDSLKNKDLDREIRVMNKSLAQARGTKTAKAAGKKLSVQVTGPTVRIVTKDEPNDIKIVRFCL